MNRMVEIPSTIEELDNQVEDKRLILANETKVNEIINLRINHNKEEPSIYIQNSHANHIDDCLKVPQNTLIIFTGASGFSSRIDSQHNLVKEDLITLLKTPIIDKEDMNKRLKDLQKGNWFPMITFHYSDYFGIIPSDDNERQLSCLDGAREMHTTESYYDLRL